VHVEPVGRSAPASVPPSGALTSVQLPDEQTVLACVHIWFAQHACP
jgi:hypothetical protein